MKLSAPDYIVLLVDDLDRAADFYVDILGLEVGLRRGPYVQLLTGATRLSLYDRRALADTRGLDLRPPAPGTPAFELGFKVEDVDASLAELEARGVEVVSGAVDHLWRQRSAIVRDPDGNLIELIQDLPGD